MARLEGVEVSYTHAPVLGGKSPNPLFLVTGPTHAAVALAVAEVVAQLREYRRHKAVYTFPSKAAGLRALVETLTSTPGYSRVYAEWGHPQPNGTVGLEVYAPTQRVAHALGQEIQMLLEKQSFSEGSLDKLLEDF